MRRLATFIFISAVLVGGLSWTPAQAGHCTSRGDTYADALRAKAAAAAELERNHVAAREASFVARQTRRYSALYGRRVGRWFGLVYTYWPRREWPRAMLCIRLESGGRQQALGSAGEIGLFQLLGYKCRPWRPETNVRLAAKRWREDGWNPWTTMRAYW